MTVQERGMEVGIVGSERSSDASSLIIPASVINKWGRGIDDMRRIIGCGLILILMSRDTEMLECASRGNTGELFSKGLLQDGYIKVFSQIVAETDYRILIHDVRKDPDWKPHYSLFNGMVSYIGLPLHWPDKSVFGVICALSNQTYHIRFSHEKEMIEQQEIIEADLKGIFQINEKTTRRIMKNYG